MGDTITVEIPGLRVQSEMNAHEHWRTIHRRKQTQQAATLLALGKPQPAVSNQPVLLVTLTRLIGKHGKQMDTDNLASAFKFVRDAVALWLGRDDSPASGITWATEQERADDWGVRIEIETTGEPA